MLNATENPIHRARHSAPLRPPPSIRNLDKPLHAHAEDPVQSHQWAALLGHSAGYHGGTPTHVAYAFVDAVLRGFVGDLRGLQTRLVWTYEDAAADVHRARGNAPWRIRKAIVRLMSENRSAAELLAAARDAGDGCTAAEARAILSDIVASELHRRRFAHAG